jgi:hypothetical protein
MLWRIALALAFAAAALSCDLGVGDLKFGVGGWTVRHWAVVPTVDFFRRACAVAVDTGGYPCAGQ